LPKAKEKAIGQWPMITAKNLASIDVALGSTGYFARLFAGWERCSNQNINALLQQFVLKKRHKANITAEEIKMIENRLNNRLRNDWDLERMNVQARPTHRNLH
jgi:IS30 family transposase